MMIVVAAVFHRNNKLLVFRRGPMVSNSGFWEFPGGKVQVGETEDLALQREIAEELKVQIKVQDFIAESIVSVPVHEKNVHLVQVQSEAVRTICIRAYFVSAMENFESNIQLSDHDSFRWISKNEMNQISLLPADIALAEKAFARV